jgi:hypothetical protein
MSKYIKKYFEQTNQEIDPYSEEKYRDDKLEKGSLDYEPGGNIIRFLKNLENPDITRLVEDLLASDDLDERMELADEILGIIQNEFEEIYDKVEDDIKKLTML